MTNSLSRILGSLSALFELRDYAHQTSREKYYPKHCFKVKRTSGACAKTSLSSRYLGPRLVGLSFGTMTKRRPMKRSI